MSRHEDVDGIDGPWTRAMAAAERDDSDARIAGAERLAQDAEQHLLLIRDEWLEGRATDEQYAQARRERDEAFRRAGLVVP